MSCRHTKPLVNPDGRIDFTKRVCIFNPPTMVAIPVGPGQLQLTPLFPVVGPSIICAQHDPRLLSEDVSASEGPKLS